MPPSDGLSTFDLLGDMPTEERTLLRIFLRHVELDDEKLSAAVAELPAAKRLTPEQTQETLETLIQKGTIQRLRRFWSRKSVYRVQQAR